MVILFKDEEQKIPGGAVLKSMNFTVNKVEILSNNSNSWIEVFNGEKSLDILKYTDTYAIIGESEVDLGAYEKIRINLSSGQVSLTNDILQIYRPKVYPLDVQEETTVEYDFEVNGSSKLNLILDFDVPNSVTRIGVGYMLTPSIDVSEEMGDLDNIQEV